MNQNRKTEMTKISESVTEAVAFAFKLSHEVNQSRTKLKPVEMVLVNMCVLGNIAALVIKLQAALRKDELIEDIRAPIFDLETDEDTKKRFMEDLERFLGKWSGLPSSPSEVN